MKHLLSESCMWISKSEFTDSVGNISDSKGETKIVIASNNEAIIESWAMLDDKKIVNNYIAQIETENNYKFIVTNSKLGIQSGTFHIDKNVIYSKFQIDKTELNGFEVIIRNNNECQVYGCLYNGKNIINSWQTSLRKVE